MIDWSIRQEVHEDPVRPEPVPVEHLSREQPAHLSRLLFGCFHHGDHLHHHHHCRHVKPYNNR